MVEPPTSTSPRSGPAPTRVIIHVDMDAFFASVEVRDHPELRGRPVLVGGTGRRGVIAAASYEARRYGCRSAQPTAVALRRCPRAIVLPPRFDVYAAVSEQVFAIFERYSPAVEGLSIDEAFLDLTGTERLLGPPRVAAERLRAEIRAETGGLTCSVGISAVKFVAKIASTMNKPDGITEVPPGREQAFLDPLPVGRLWGVGPKAAARLGDHGIATIGQLRALSEPTLVAWFGENGSHLWRLSRAIDPRPVEVGRQRKQVGHEDTFAEDVVGRRDLERKLLSQATRVADRLVAKGLRGRRVQIKIRDLDFKTETRQLTLDAPTDQAKVIYAAARDLLGAIEVQGRRFRLTGVSVGELVRTGTGEPEQLDLLAVASSSPGARLQGVVTRIRRRYGHHALYPADAGPTEREGSAGGGTRTLDED